MSTNTNTGGPAFPISDPGLPQYDGMTLRDYFAAKAMQGFLATVKVGCPDDLIAIDAYNLADAMLKARGE
jgi:hypothetical protein